MFGKYRDIDLYIKSMNHLLEYDGMYDEVYAMHGLIPVKPDLVGKLIEGANQIKNHEVSGNELDFLGKKVVLYKFPYAGFLCES